MDLNATIQNVEAKYGAERGSILAEKWADECEDRGDTKRADAWLRVADALRQSMCRR